MGIPKKGKRKLVHKGVIYYWWVGDDYEGPTGHEIEVTISSEDKQFLVKYYINQKENHFVTVLGKRFGGNVKTGGQWKRFASPKFGEVTTFTPKHVVGWIQVISATRLPIKASRGVSPFSTFLGVKFNNRMLSLISLSVSVAMSNFFGQKRLIRPLVFSFVPRCQLA